MNQRIDNLKEVIRYGTEIEIMIRKDIIHGDSDYFKEQREAYNNLLNDNQLFIFEQDYINHEGTIYSNITITRQDK